MPVYNQKAYVAQAIESVLNQKTDFDYCIILGDDFSTDGTREICRQFATQHPDVIQLFENKSNTGLIENYKNLFSKCNAKYVSILEGDDYWIDDSKLQEQVNILENNDDVSFVHSDCLILYEDGVLKTRNKYKNTAYFSGNAFEKLFKGNFITAGTVCFRRQCYNDIIKLDVYNNLGVRTIDGFMWIELAHNFRIEYIPRPTLLYRVLANSISNNKNYECKRDFIISAYNALCYLADKYNPEGTNRRDLTKRMLWKLIVHAIKSKKYLQLFQLLIRRSATFSKAVI